MIQDPKEPKMQTTNATIKTGVQTRNTWPQIWTKKNPQQQKWHSNSSSTKKSQRSLTLVPETVAALHQRVGSENGKVAFCAAIFPVEAESLDCS